MKAICLAALLLLPMVLSVCAEAVEPKRVLIIHSFGCDLEPYNAIGAFLRTKLTQQLREPVAYEDVSLDAERGGLPDERAFVDYLRRRASAIPDLVVAIANPAMLFCLRYRGELFPDPPPLVTGIDRRRVAGIKVGERDRVVSTILDFLATARTILQLRVPVWLAGGSRNRL